MRVALLFLNLICAAMMSMQHKCLVTFLGAGVMSEPKHGLRVLFNVQVAMNGTILLFASACKWTELRVVVVHRSSCQAAHWIGGYGTSPGAV